MIFVQYSGKLITLALNFKLNKNHRSSEVELEIMNANQDQPIPYAVFENDIRFPIPT